MITLNYSEVPADLKIDEPYSMELTASDESDVCGIINQGIDSHLEAVFFDDHGVKNGKRCIDIKDSKSMRCFLRRCMEGKNENLHDLASCIMYTLGYEWL